MHDDLLGELLDTAASRLAAYGFLLTGSQRTGDDLVRAAIVKVLVRRRLLRDVRVAEANVRVAMRSLHLAAIRRSSSWRGSFAPPAVAPPEPHTTPGATDSVGHAMASLSVEQRAAVVLRHVDQLQAQEIAAAMRVSGGTVERLLAQAHAVLGATLGDIAPAEERVLIVETRRR